VKKATLAFLASKESFPSGYVMDEVVARDR
jgi:hypothetical protein